MWASLKQTYGGSSGNTGITGTFLSNQRSSGLSRVGWAFDAFPLFLSFCCLAPDTEKGWPNEPGILKRSQRQSSRICGSDTKQQTTDSENWRDKQPNKSQTGYWVGGIYMGLSQISLERLWKLHWQWNHSPQKDGKNLWSKPKWVNCLLKQNCQHSFLYWNNIKTPNAEMTNTLGLSDKDVKAAL